MKNNLIIFLLTLFIFIVITERKLFFKKDINFIKKLVKLIIILFIICIIIFCRKGSKKSKRIPKKIHQVWVGTKDISEYKHKIVYMKSFKDILDDSWEYKLWTNDDITKKNFPLTYHYIKKIEKEKLKLNQFPYSAMADLMKFEIVYHHGGFYFDTNIELLQNLDKFLNNKFIICNEDGNIYNYMSCGFFGGIKESKYLKKLLSKKNLDEIDVTDINVNITTGPYFFHKAFENDYRDVLLLDSKKIYPVGPNQFDDCSIDLNITYPCDKYKDSIAIDHFIFGGSWIKNKKNNSVKKIINNNKDYLHYFYINLLEREDRNKFILDQFKTNDKIIHRIDAIKNSDGATGCGLSHIKALKEGKKFAIENNLEYIVIIEDDFKLINDLKTTNNLLKDIINYSDIDWDVLVLTCGCFLNNENKICVRNEKNDYLLKVINCSTTAGYIIKIDYVDKLVNNFQEAIELRIKHNVNKNTNDSHEINNFNTSIDQYWKKLQKIDNWYVPQKYIATQRKDYSNIEDKLMEYKIINRFFNLITISLVFKKDGNNLGLFKKDNNSYNLNELDFLDEYETYIYNIKDEINKFNYNVYLKNILLEINNIVELKKNKIINIDNSLICMSSDKINLKISSDKIKEIFNMIFINNNSFDIILLDNNDNTSEILKKNNRKYNSKLFIVKNSAIKKILKNLENKNYIFNGLEVSNIKPFI